MFVRACALGAPMQRKAASALARTGALCCVAAAPLYGLSTATSSPSVAASAFITARRWCCTTSGTSTTATGAAADAGLAAKAEAAALMSTSPLAAAAATTAAIPNLAHQLKGLSAADQKRIFEALQHPEAEKSSTMGGAGIGPRGGDMVAAFTCGPCEYHMVKRFSKHAYTKGIVIVECPNCRAKHLLADNLGWVQDEAKNIEEILKEKGEQFTRIEGSSGDFEVTGEAAETMEADADTKAPPA